MTPRTLTVVCLRLMAVWILCAALLMVISSLQSMIFVFTAQVPAAGTLRSWAISPLVLAVGFGLHAGVAGGLFRYAPRIADRIVADTSGDTQVCDSKSLGAGTLYHLGSLLLGLFFLGRSIAPAVRGLAYVMSTGAAGSLRLSYAVGLVEAGVLAVFGLALVFGSRGLARFIDSLGYDSDNLPAQQFTLRLLFVVVVVAAVALGLIRVFVDR